MATLVSFEEKFDVNGKLQKTETSSNYNSTEEALAQAKHDIATGQNGIVKVIGDDGVEILAGDM